MRALAPRSASVYLRGGDDAWMEPYRMNLDEKLSILADAEKYDASCASSGSRGRRAGAGGIGSTEVLTGIVGASARNSRAS